MRIKWDEVLTNAKVKDAYRRFADGRSSAREVEKEFKNTEHITRFRSLVRERGVDRAKDAVRLALSRRKAVRAS